MTSFIEKLIDHELPTSGFRTLVDPRELLRDQRDPKALTGSYNPKVQGFFERRWRHGNLLQQTGQNYAVNFSDRLKLGEFSLKNQFALQNGNSISYRANLSLDLKDAGEIEFTRQAKNTKIADLYQITHYNSRNGLQTRASLSFQEPTYHPVLNLSSLYRQTIEIFDRKSMKLNKRTSIYGIDTSFGFSPIQQLNYSLFFQSKGTNYDLIAAYIRKSMGEKFFSNNVIAGVKYRTLDNKKLLAKLNYSVEDRLPQIELMVRNKHSTNKGLTSFHKISNDLKAGSGFTLKWKNLRLHGLAEVNLLQSDFNCQPFNFGFRVELGEKDSQKVGK